MRKAVVKIHNIKAGIFTEENKTHYSIQYNESYEGPPISLTMPVRSEVYTFDSFPAYFDGVLPEGSQLEGLLKVYKVDSDDYFQQLLITGLDLVGAVTVEEIKSTI